MQNSTSTVETPTLKRRLICLVYEAFLVTAVAALGIALATPLLNLLNDQWKPVASFLVLFLFVGLYFIHTWTGSGFTLAMKTWRIKVVKLGHATVPFKAAAIRYALAWGYVLPGLAVGHFAGLTRGQSAIAVGVGIVAWTMTALLDKDRQFLHDKLAGTRLIALPKAVKAPAPAK